MPHQGPESTSPFEVEIEHGHADYSDAELLEQCQWNVQALVLAVFDAVEGDVELLDRLVERVAGAFARGWDMRREWQPEEILDALLTNYRSFGATVESFEPDGAAPHAVLAGLPSDDLTERLQIAATAFRQMLTISERIVAQLGCELEWSHDALAGRIRLQVQRPE